MFLRAVHLPSLSVYSLDADTARLINALSCYGSLREIQVWCIKDHEGSVSGWYRSLSGLGRGWRKLLLGGDLSDVCPEHVYNEMFESVFPQFCDIEEIGLP
jgi:hypothetical protein